MDTTQLARTLKKDRPASTYLVAGEEQSLVDRALALISSRILAEAGSSDFALTRLDGRSCSAAEVEAAARTASLFGGRRLVVLRDAQLLRPKEQDKLVVYLKAPVPTTSLVVVVRGADPATRDPKQAKAAKAAKKFKKAVEAGKGLVVTCPRPKARDLPRLAEQALSEADLGADRDGLYALVEAIGEDLGALWQAVEKLRLYKGGQGQVSARDVADVVADTRTQSVFELTDAVAEGDLVKALKGVRRLVRDGESPLAVLGHLVRHFRNLARVQALASRGQPVDAIRQALGLHPFVVKKSLQQSRRFKPAGLTQRLKLLAEADLALKGGGLPDPLALEVLIRSLCEVERHAQRRTDPIRGVRR